MRDLGAGGEKMEKSDSHDNMTYNRPQIKSFYIRKMKSGPPNFKSSATTRPTTMMCKYFKISVLENI